MFVFFTTEVLRRGDDTEIYVEAMVTPTGSPGRGGFEVDFDLIECVGGAPLSEKIVEKNEAELREQAVQEAMDEALHRHQRHPA